MYNAEMKLTKIGVNQHGILTILCGILDYSKTWPAVVDHEGRTYAFTNQTTMPQDAVGHYGGCAEYEPITGDNDGLSLTVHDTNTLQGTVEFCSKGHKRYDRWPRVVVFDGKLYEYLRPASTLLKQPATEIVQHAFYQPLKNQLTDKDKAAMTIKNETKATPVKAGQKKVAHTAAKPVKAPKQKAPAAKPAKAPKQPKVTPAQKAPSGKATTAKVKPAPKNTAATRDAVKKPRNVAKPLPEKGAPKAAAKVAAKVAKPTFGVAKNITVDQLINFAKSEKTLNQAGKFVQILQFESSRKNFTVKLNVPVRVNGDLVVSVKLNASDILLLDAEAAKVFRHIDVANVTLKFKRI